MAATRHPSAPVGRGPRPRRPAAPPLVGRGPRPRRALPLALALATLLSLPAAAATPPPPVPVPRPADARCGRFGWDPLRPPGPPPVAGPLVSDLSTDGSLQPVAAALREALAHGIDLAGAFRRLPEGTFPASGVVLWPDDEAFDWIGWWEAGAWMVVTAEARPEEGGVGVRLDAWMVEEGDRLALSEARAVLPPDRVTAFARRWVNALLQCVTTVPGSLGTRVAFARRLPGRPAKQIFVAEVGDAQAQPVSDDPEGALLPAWAPGGRLAWTGYAKGNPDLYLEGAVLSDRPGLNTGAAFSPDGTLLALTLAPEGNPDVWLVDPATGAERARLTSSRGIDTSPAWSPDGRRLAFVSDRAGTPQVWLMNADGSEPRPLPLPGDYNTSPDWSPDGALIAYQSRGAGDRFSIWTVDWRTGDARPLTSGRTNDEEPSWSPDGRQIAYTSAKRGGRKALWVMDRDGRHARPLFPGEPAEDFTPAWERVFPATPGN